MLKRVIDEKNQLQDSKTHLGEELKDVQALLANSMKENKRLRGGIFIMCSNLPLHNPTRKGTDRVMSVGMLTGRPEEEMSGSSRDLLQELATTRASSEGNAECCQGLMALRLPSRKYGGACTAIQGSVAAFPIVEDIGLPGRCTRSLVSVSKPADLG